MSQFHPRMLSASKSTYEKKSVILLLCASTYIAGTERVVQSLARGLSARQVVVETVIPWEADEADRIAKTIEWHRQAGVEVRAAGEFSRRNTGWRNIWTLAKFLRTFSEVKIVNIHYTQNTSVSLTDILAIRLAGKRPVVMVHHPTEWGEIKLRQYRIIKIALSLADIVVASTECMAKLLREAGVSTHKIATIPPGVAMPKKIANRDEARDKFGIPSDSFVVSILARLVAEKGIFELLEAFSQLPAVAKQDYLIIAGDGPDREALERKAGEHVGKNILFPGKVKDISDVYAAADVFAMPSYWEGFGLVYAEAAFHGLACIGTDVGGIPYVIRDGETGILVPPKDVPSLFAALICLREQAEVRRHLGNAARDRAYAEFTEEKMTTSFLNLFQKLIPSKLSKIKTLEPLQADDRG